MKGFAPLRVLGLMSGTSMDGVDGAVLVTDGERITAFGPSAFRPYTAPEAAALAAAQGLWPGEAPARIRAAEQVILESHRALAGQFGAIALLGFHGQTLAHAPAAGRSHQLGDGAALAAATGIRTVWDFRTKDMAAGGCGAPLAPFFHWACARRAGLAEPVAFLNLGGVGNLTVVNPAAATPDSPGALLAFDTGPANAPLNDLMLARLGRPFDENGMLAARGAVHAPVLTRLLRHPCFARPPPRALDRHDFHAALDLVADLPDAAAAATLTALPAACVAANLCHLETVPNRWFVCGGGARNPRMMFELARRLPGTVAPAEAIGLNGDMLEAQAFAYLAVRVLRGLPTSAPGTTGCGRPVSGGRISPLSA
ncbi:MAG: anhydro-N-acetylmuramic acid kinase [Rhodobacteraceae bacterium]|nr:anhydro-N-acetylmuramic acid kinase [Paracoccaceae bacterium]